MSLFPLAEPPPEGFPSKITRLNNTFILKIHVHPIKSQHVHKPVDNVWIVVDKSPHNKKVLLRL